MMVSLDLKWAAKVIGRKRIEYWECLNERLREEKRGCG